MEAAEVEVVMTVPLVVNVSLNVEVSLVVVTMDESTVDAGPSQCLKEYR